jgi:multiple sugar transport system ATP-binding protein
LASLELNHVRKHYGDTLVLDDVSLAVEAREFIAFLGPSGSGKSTLLRMIAGLETLDSGEVWLDGRRIDSLPPGQRDVAMVFQHYALYPHMTVRENMAFGLRNAGVPKGEIDERIEQAARVLEIASQLEKKPAQMSGGQRQRVAIGRAIVKHPRLFLLDEPLSNLDAALRNRTRVELAQLRQRVDAALIMVTHDQAEAMTLADRIVVINDKRIQQVGAPMEVYTRPANAFVARFVGSPAMTLAPGTIVPGQGPFARVRLGCGAEVDTRVSRGDLEEGASVELGLRSEYVSVTSPGAGTAEAETVLVERLGDRTLVYARLSDGLEVTAQDEGNSRVTMGDRVGLRIDGAAVHVFGPDGVGRHPEARDG